MADDTKYIETMAKWDQAKNLLDEQELKVRQIKLALDNLYDASLLSLKDEKITAPIREATIKQGEDYQKLQQRLITAELMKLQLKIEERAARLAYQTEKSTYFNDMRIEETSRMTPDNRYRLP